MPSEGTIRELLAFGDIVLAPFPYTDQSTTKRRPAVVISSATYNLSRPDVIIMAVTSQVRTASIRGDVRLEAWEAAGLLKPSVLKPIIATLERGLVIRKLGALSRGDESALRGALAEMIG